MTNIDVSTINILQSTYYTRLRENGFFMVPCGHGFAVCVASEEENNEDTGITIGYTKQRYISKRDDSKSINFYKNESILSVRKKMKLHLDSRAFGMNGKMPIGSKQKKFSYTPMTITVPNVRGLTYRYKFLDEISFIQQGEWIPNAWHDEEIK